MADLSKLKTPRRNSLGDPPPPEAATKNLLAPEVAPAPEAFEPEEQGEAASGGVVQLRPSSAPPPAAAERIEKKGPPKPAKRRIDGRSLRKTGRTLPFATRVSEKFDEQLRTIAERDGLNFAELLEKSLDAYEAGRKR